MKRPRFLASVLLCLLALFGVTASMDGAAKKQATAKKTHAAKTVPKAENPAPQEDIQLEIKNLKDDVYTRATWKALQDIKKEADDTAGTVKRVTFIGGGIGFIVGCAVTWLLAKRVGKSEDRLNIT